MEIKLRFAIDLSLPSDIVMGMNTTIKLSKSHQELFESCHLHCSVCMDDGGCSLQKKYKKELEKRLKRNVRDEEIRQLVL